MKHKKKSSTTPIKISVVVPVYQVEQFLPQCLNSILAQTLKELEIIVVDDGSPDNCGHIIDEYAKKDSRIIPIHQDNQGYGSAVNNGIKRAHGQYLAVVESDDFLEPEMYAKLYAKAEKYHADIAKCSFYNFNQDNQQKTISSEHPDQLFPCPN
ncbi:glycosyltransferase family 2 protein, partial [bacterium]|nr:glycosyltransferase family 2 protein [bacterium]